MQQDHLPDGTPGESSRRKKTREKLLQAAYEVFAETGVHAASVEMITERAGFTRGAFYSNFDSKEELFFALAEREMLERFAKLQQGIDSILPGIDASQSIEILTIEKIVADFLALQMDDRRWTLMQSEFRLNAMRDTEQAPRYLEFERDFRERLAARLDDALASVGLTVLHGFRRRDPHDHRTLRVGHAGSRFCRTTRRPAWPPPPTRCAHSPSCFVR